MPKHIGPQLNYLHSCAENFFTTRHTTGWGPTVNLEGREGAFVRAAREAGVLASRFRYREIRSVSGSANARPASAGRGSS